MTLLTLADHTAAGARRETVRFDEDPAGAARARVTSPALLGRADHRHGGGWWRDLRLDAAARGLAAQRARPSALVIDHGDGDEPWPVAVPGLLGCALAWSPFAPRVAGLALDGACARPWVADYAQRSVRILAHVRAAMSLTGLERGGGAPLCWLDEHTLAVLTASAPALDLDAEPGDPVDAGPGEEPLIYDATGPGFVSFEPGLDELRVAAGAAVARLDLRDEWVEPLTGPLLVGALQPPDERGRGILVRHVTDLRAGAGRDGLLWSDTRVEVGPRSAVRVPATRAGDVASRPHPRPPGGTEDITAGDGAPRLSSSIRSLAVPGLPHAARLACFASPPPHDSHRTSATLLWIRAARGPLACGTPIPAPLPGTSSPTATLDLPLHWPADATPAALHEQIAGAVHAAVAAIGDGPVVVGGHSFGATLALFALARVPGLAGAIAHSGCYNRTHTPFGFHYERRSYWDAPEIYRAFSALDFADRIRRPALLVHGLEDANPATPPDQAVALYRAIVATGGSARLVLLPGEEHSFRYRETQAHLTEIHRDWLERAAHAR
jgi:dienelactone hydrolase